MDKLLLTPEEAAQVIAVGRSRLYELLRVGAIESVRIGSSRRISVQALEEYVERLRAQSSGYLVS
ncbi:MAG: helix-turn-helix domain-containing protein [Actinomycetota bacterium]|nr:helix-turn-helix domain-containing protein [Actinomycetota bacterium]